MSSADVLLALRRCPFDPFRIEVSDGSAYEVWYPEMVMVGLSSVIVGIPPVGAVQLPYERYEMVSLRHIVKLTPLAQSVGGGNGEG